LNFYPHSDLPALCIPYISCGPVLVLVSSYSGVLSKRMSGSSWLLAQRLRSTLCCNSGISEIKYFSLRDFAHNSRRRKFAFVATCCQLSSTNADTRRDKRANVISRTYNLTVLATVDVRCQFITLSVHLCVQHDACQAARRAGPSATADTLDQTNSGYKM